MRRDKTDYVDNEKLYQCFVEWHEKRKEALENGLKEPEPPGYISECILLITRRLASKKNFAGYTFKEEMIGDAIENIIKYYRNFDPSKSKNPFAYFTQIAYFAFLRRILKEKKQAYIKHKLIKNSNLSDAITLLQDEEDNFKISYMEFLKNNLDKDFEKYFVDVNLKRNRKRLKKEKNTIEDLLGE